MAQKTQLKDHCMHFVVHYCLGALSARIVDFSIAITIGRRRNLLHGRTVCREIFCKRNDVLSYSHGRGGEGIFVESVRHMRSTVRSKEEQTFCANNHFKMLVLNGTI